MSIIEEFLRRADVPETRRVLTKPENIKWLVNNLGIRNSAIEGFEATSTELKRLHIEHVHGRLPMGHPCRQTE